MIDDLGHDILKMTKIATILLIVVIILLILANGALEWFKWRCLRSHLDNIRQAWNTDPTIYHHTTTGSPPVIQLTNHNLLTLHGITAHPLLMRIANQFSSFFRLSHSKHIHVQWFFSYVFHPPVLVCFLIGFVGLLAVQIQLLALGPIAESYRNKALNSATDFSNTIATSLNQNMMNQSAIYVSQVNSEVDGIQNHINDGVFGWVNSTTSTLNTTLNNFYGDVQELVQTVFGGTPLEKPMQDFVFCLVGSKVDALSDALTFMHDHLHVDMPRMNQSSLLLSPQDVNDAARPIALAAIGSGNGDGDDDGGIVGRIVSGYVKSLEKERTMFLIFIGVWAFVVLLALLIIFWHSYIKPVVDKRKKRKWHKEQREGFDQFTARGAHITVTDESSIENGGRRAMNLPSFTPLASPRPGFLEALTSPRRRIGSPKSPNGFLKPPSHPSKNYEKSWESFLDASKENEKGGLPPVAKPTVQFKTTSRGFLGMNPFGRRTMDKEKFVIDIDDDEPVSTGKPASVPVFSRLAAFNPFGRKQQDLKPRSVSPPSLTSPRPGNRPSPNLSIDISRAANMKPENHPTIETPSPIERDEPKSAWSVSPVAPRFPWVATGGGDGGRKSQSSSPLRVRNFDTGSINFRRVDAERESVVVEGLAPPPGISPVRVRTQFPPRGPSPPPFSQYQVPTETTTNNGPPVDPFATPFDASSDVKSQRQPARGIPSPGTTPTNPFLNAAEAWKSSTNGSPFTPVAI